ncbi:coiled-coil domain-containing protein [Wolbachia endosymbiont of Drosophila simulans]|uniref:hypothetical protein n=1 Tax=Wolbachia endosymbiont of Drosophila simulans TaxID=77038 RepID=UPI0003A248EA|nr:hypothetical protein [Wolbachia endosymbiont of Drosophila simulans]
MSNNIYSDQVNNSNLYANKLFYGEDDDELEGDLLRDYRDETEKVKDKLVKCTKGTAELQEEIGNAEAETSKLKLQVQEEKGKVEQTKNEAKTAKAEVKELKLQIQREKENVEEEFKGKIEQAENEAKAAKAEVEELKLQVQKEKENVEAEFKGKIEQAENEAKTAKAEAEKFKNQAKEEREKVEQTKNEAEAAKDGLIQCKKDAEKMKENGGQAINQEKCDDIKAEAEQAKLEAKLAKEEVLRCKIEQEKEEVMQSKIEGVKEELLKCKINMAKAETEWYKKAAEECQNEKRIDTDKPSIKGGNESGEITSQEITPNHSEQENCGVYARYYQANNKIGHQGFNTSDLLRELYPEMYSNPRIAKHIEKGTDGHYGAVNLNLPLQGILIQQPVLVI